MNANLELTDVRNSNHWIKSACLVTLVYMLSASIIWFLFYREQLKSVVTEPIAAPIVLEISTTPTTDAQFTNLVDEQNEQQAQQVKSVNVAPEAQLKLVSVKSEQSEDVKALEPTKEEHESKNTKPQHMQNEPIQPTDQMVQQADQEQLVNEMNRLNQKVQQANQRSEAYAKKDDQAKAPKEGSLNNDNSQLTDQQWENQVLAKLQKMKRYPAYAQSQKQQDVVTIKIELNAKGELINSIITQSQKFEVLDNEVRSLVKRAQPFPIPPLTALNHQKVTLEVPVEFFLK